MSITVFGTSFIGSLPSRGAAERPVWLEVRWEKAGEGNPGDPAQARRQMSLHVQSGGAVAGPTGARFRLHALSDMTRFFNLLEWWRIAGRLYGNGAAQTAFV